MKADKPDDTERAVLVHVNFPAAAMQEDMAELQELAISAGASPAALITAVRQSPDPKYFIGTGKAEEVKAAVLAVKADIVIFNHVLSPGQERNLERLLHCRVIDRTGLILDIFAQRARSFEGKLQVELALLKHLSTRLVRGWTHLERQRGGIGLRGPGETQLEVDRRLIRQRIEFITARLSRVKKQRQQSRRARERAALPTVALVGYTNAGKSTLFNRLTGAEVYAADRLFATLDPTLRRINLPETGPVILADTVGFIRHLPHDLVKAFQATLEEVSQADLLLHVVDAHDEHKQANMLQVQEVLASLGAENIPQIVVYNKIDLCPYLQTQIQGNQVWISAEKNQGIDLLIQIIQARLNQEKVQHEVVLTPAQAQLRAALFAEEAVVTERIDDQGCYHLVVRMPESAWQKWVRKLASKPNAN